MTSDGINATLGGLLSQRLNFQAAGRASTGAIGFAAAHDFDSYYGNASLGYAVSRHVNVGATYAYYSHRFDPGVALPADFANRFNRHSVRLSVSVWAPLYQRARRTNASR